MFQDVVGDFCIEYDASAPGKDDYVLACKGRTALCSIKNGRLYLPQVADMKDDTGLVHAFAVGGKRFFFVPRDIPEAEGFEYTDIDDIKLLEASIWQFAAVTGYHYRCFHEENRFCGKCGGKTVHSPEKRCMICTACSNRIYPKISPAVIVGVIDEETDSILLTKYAGRKFKKYALVAGFIEMGESAEQAARREVMEETGIEIGRLDYFASQPWGFSQNILTGFFARATGSRKIVMDKSELSEAKWVRREELDARENSVSLTNEMIWAFKSGRV